MILTMIIMEVFGGLNCVDDLLSGGKFGSECGGFWLGERTICGGEGMGWFC